MTFHPRLSAWPPAPPSSKGAHEDRCVADPAAPMKDWIYKAPAIGFVLSGWFDYLTEDRAILAAPGAVLLGNAGEAFNVRHHDVEGNTRLVMLLDQTLLDEVANEAALDAARFRAVALPPGPKATRIYAWMRGAAFGGDAAEECEINLASAALAAPIAEGWTQATPTERKSALAAARYIEAHFAGDCGLSTLANAANVSRYRLVHAFTAAMGQSPIQYLINVRVRAAADLLRASKAAIADIAFDTGFNDISHFYACFKTAIGVTPRQWRIAH